MSKLTTITTTLALAVLNPDPPKPYGDYMKITNKFYGVSDTCTIYVPKGSVEVYRKAKGWKEFKNIKPRFP